MLIERFKKFQAQDFIFKIATSEEDINGFHSLRRRIFCDEQGVFENDDRDIIDEHMIPIICKPLIAGMEDDVIGDLFWADETHEVELEIVVLARGWNQFQEIISLIFLQSLIFISSVIILEKG